MATGSHRWFPSRYDNDKDVAVKEALEERDKNYDPDYLQSFIIDEKEVLYLRGLRRKFITAWAILGNGALLATVGAIVSISPRGLQLEEAISGAALLLSTPVSIILLYRQHKLIRRSKLRIRKLGIAHSRNKQSLEPQKDGENLLNEHRRYRDQLPEVISEYRAEANHYRRWHNGFQSVIIVGSVSTSAITTASVSYAEARWLAVAVSAIVGLAAGFTGYFKYRERSFNLQQTADAIEREYESVELRVGRYKKLSEVDAFSEFANYVEQLRDEQNKRQQQLDQPVESKNEVAT